MIFCKVTYFATLRIITGTVMNKEYQIGLRLVLVTSIDHLTSECQQ